MENFGDEPPMPDEEGSTPRQVNAFGVSTHGYTNTYMGEQQTVNTEEEDLVMKEEKQIEQSQPDVLKGQLSVDLL